MLILSSCVLINFFFAQRDWDTIEKKRKEQYVITKSIWCPGHSRQTTAAAALTEDTNGGVDDRGSNTSKVELQESSRKGSTDYVSENASFTMIIWSSKRKCVYGKCSQRFWTKVFTQLCPSVWNRYWYPNIWNQAHMMKSWDRCSLRSIVCPKDLSRSRPFHYVYIATTKHEGSFFPAVT